MRVLRVFHAGRDPAHRLRDRALVRAGADLTYVVPAAWPEAGAQRALSEEPFRVVELPVRRAGDVNRHTYADAGAFGRLVNDVRPDIVDLLEEPVSAVAHQLSRAVGAAMPLALYTAQNLDKRFPPPFAQWERSAYSRAHGIYPCSRQAASVAVGKGYAGVVEVLPLGHDPATFFPGTQSLDDAQLTLGFVGRLVAHKGAVDAVHVLRAVRDRRPARLLLVGAGPQLAEALAEADRLGVRDAVQHVPWTDAAGLAALYRQMHVVLVPSRASATWVEQFGRVIVEGWASGAVVAGYASGSIPEVAGDAGVLVAEGDRRALAERVAAVLTDAGEWERHRQLGSAAAATLTWDQVAQDQLAFYEQVLAAGPPPPPGRDCRALARGRFGPPAAVPGTERPFALPVLRDTSRATRVLERAVDRLLQQ